MSNAMPQWSMQQVKHSDTCFECFTKNILTKLIFYFLGIYEAKVDCQWLIHNQWARWCQKNIFGEYIFDLKLNSGYVYVTTLPCVHYFFCHIYSNLSALSLQYRMLPNVVSIILPPSRKQRLMISHGPYDTIWVQKTSLTLFPTRFMRD